MQNVGCMLKDEVSRYCGVLSLFSQCAMGLAYITFELADIKVRIHLFDVSSHAALLDNCISLLSATSVLPSIMLLILDPLHPVAIKGNLFFVPPMTLMMGHRKLMKNFQLSPRSA